MPRVFLERPSYDGSPLATQAELAASVAAGVAAPRAARGDLVAMGGQGTVDTTMTGLYDRNELTLVTQRGGSVAATMVGGGTAPQAALEQLFDAQSGFGTLTLAETTTAVEIVVDRGLLVPNYGFAAWQPFFQMRYGGTASRPGHIAVHVSHDGSAWHAPADPAAWAASGPFEAGALVSGLWMGANAVVPTLPGFRWRYVRFTLSDLVRAGGTPSALWVVQAGMRHVSAPYAPQYAPYSVCPPGTVQLFAGAALPPGWLACEGQAVSRTTYAELFAAIGTTWGAGNGTTTFNVPDLRGRVALGTGTGPGRSPRALGQVGGAESHALSAAEMPPHTHGLLGATLVADDGYGDVPAVQGGAWVAQGGATGSAGGGQAHPQMPPFAALRYMIRAM